MALDRGELVLGFDCRFSEAGVRPAFLSHYRKLGYGIRSDYLFPFSADPRIWPSKFEGFVGFDVDSDWYQRIPVEEPSYFQLYIGLWEDFSSMIYKLERHGARSRNLYEVALTVVVSSVSQAQLDDWRGRRSGGAWSASLGQCKCRLGYDVVNNSLLSAIFNCGPIPGCQEPIDRFRGFVNECGLFNAGEAACKFARWAEENYADHAPFFVVGVYINPNVSSSIITGYLERGCLRDSAGELSGD